MSEKIRIKGEGAEVGAIVGSIATKEEFAEKLALLKAEAEARAINEARAILARYRPETGRGASLNEPSQGEAQRMLDCIQSLYAMIQAPASRVQHQEIKLETR